METPNPNRPMTTKPKENTRITMWVRDKDHLEAEASAMGMKLSAYLRYLIQTNPQRKAKK